MGTSPKSHGSQGGAQFGEVATEGSGQWGVFNQLRFGIVVTDRDTAVVGANDTAHELLTPRGAWPQAATCCLLFGCRGQAPLEDHCLTELAADSPEALPEVRLDVPPDRPSMAVWVTAARLKADGSQVVMHLRPAAIADRRRRTHPTWVGSPQVQIRALGRTQVKSQGVTIDGEWLLQRPGQLLKYLVCQRGRPAHVDEIADSLWPSAGVAGRNNVRHYIHGLRERLEPSRSRRSPSAYVVSTGSSYSLGPQVAVDLDEFEDLVSAGLGQQPGGEDEGLSGVDCLERAVSLYRGELFAEEPFAEWAFAERELARSMVTRALSYLVEHYFAVGNLASATTHLERSAEMRPLDSDVQRRLIGIYVRQGRHSDASRRFGNFRQRMLDEFQHSPEFTLSDLAEEAKSSPRP